MSEEALQLRITLDDPWNALECDAFDGRQAEANGPHPPGLPEATGGRGGHLTGDVIDYGSSKVTPNTSAGEGRRHELF